MNTYSTLARRANGIKVYLLFLLTYTMLIDQMTNTYGSLSISTKWSDKNSSVIQFAIQYFKDFKCKRFFITLARKATSFERNQTTKSRKYLSFDSLVCTTSKAVRALRHIIFKLDSSELLVKLLAIAKAIISCTMFEV